MVADLGHRADGRARGADGVALAKRDRRRDAVDAIDLWLVHSVKKLADVRRECLDVAALAFGKKRIEGERTFTGTTQPGEHDQFALGQVEVEILEVVMADAAKPNHAVGVVAWQWSGGRVSPWPSSP